MLSPKYLIGLTKDHQIAEDKLNDFFNLLSISKLALVQNSTELPIKSKEYLKTYITYAISQTRYYLYCTTILLSITPLKKDFLNQDTKNYYSLKSYFENYEHTPHIYSLAHKCFTTTTSLKKDTSIALIGSSGSGKSFNISKVLQFLFFISSQKEINKEIYDITSSAIKLMHIVGNCYTEDNYNSSSCGYIYHIGFSPETNEINYFDIDSEILDITMPFSESGRSFTLLHGYVLTQKETIKGASIQMLNFFKKYYKNLLVDENGEKKLLENNKRDIEAWESFKNISKRFITEKDYEKILNVFYILILCNEVTILKNKRFVNGKKVESFYINKNNVTKKLSALLNVEEKKFLELFTKCTTMQEHKTLLVSIMKYSYYCVHDFILGKVKSKLQSVFAAQCPNSTKGNCIHIIDFPGESQEETLGGLVINLSMEFLNLYSMSNYTAIISALEQNGIRLKRFEAPLSFEIIRAVTSLISFIAEKNQQKQRDSMKKLITHNDHMPTVIEYFGGKSIVKINYSYNSVYYSFPDLIMESMTTSVPKNVARLLRHTKNEIYGGNANSGGSFSSFSMMSSSSICSTAFVGNNARLGLLDFILNKLKYLFCGIEEINPFVVYCVKSEEIFRKYILSTNRRFKRSSIFNVLDWEWDGYSEWITINDFVNEFYSDFDKIKSHLIQMPDEEDNTICENNEDKCQIIITVMSLERECKIGKNFLAMRKGTLFNLRKIFNSLLENIKDAKGSKKVQKLGIAKKNNDSNNPSDIISVDIFSSELVDLVHSGKNRYSIENLLSKRNITEQNENNVIVANEEDYKEVLNFFTINKDVQNKPFDVEPFLPFIILIQSRFRGYLVRHKIMRVYIFVKFNVILLQRNIRGLLARSKFGKFLLCLKKIILIQYFFKARYKYITEMCTRIQRKFRETINTVYNPNHQKNKKKRKPTQSKKEKIDICKETNKEKIVEYLLFNSFYDFDNHPLYGEFKKLDKKRNAKNKRHSQPVEDRLIQYGREVKMKKIQLASRKLNGELDMYSFQPRINTISNQLEFDNFFIRNEKFLKEREEKMMFLKNEMYQKFKEEHTFQPAVTAMAANMRRDVGDLYEWYDKVEQRKEINRKLYEDYKSDMVQQQTAKRTKEEIIAPTFQKENKNLTSNTENPYNIDHIIPGDSTKRKRVAENIWPNHLKKKYLIK